MEKKYNRLLSLLGLCKKAGKLVEGFEAAKQGMLAGTICLVLTARDLSEKSRKEIRYIAQKQNIEHETIPVCMDEIWRRTGRRAGILAVADKGFADAIKSEMCRQSEGGIE